VYTWVNGSDPKHIQSRHERSRTLALAALSENRFRDMGGLLYSLRSVEKYANWIRKIWIVSDDQVPTFLNTDSPRVAIVSHREIFKKHSDLPTFNSNAIEANLHNLPKEVAECFVFLNDDMLFMNNVEPKDFWIPGKGQILYPSSWTAPPSKDKLSNSWHRAIKRGNELFDSAWGPEVRHYASHGPYFFMRDSLNTLYDFLRIEFDATSSRPSRNENDTTLPFLYMHHTLHNYLSFVAPTTINYYAKLSDNLRSTQQALDSARKTKPKTACLNDGLSNDHPNPEVLTYLEKEFFQKIFPYKSQFEK